MEELEKRLNDLEVKFTFQDDLITQLNEIVTEQQFTIDKLKNELKTIQSSIKDLGSGGATNLADEKPPHY